MLTGAVKAVREEVYVVALYKDVAEKYTAFHIMVKALHSVPGYAGYDSDRVVDCLHPVSSPYFVLLIS